MTLLWRYDQFIRIIFMFCVTNITIHRISGISPSFFFFSLASTKIIKKIFSTSTEKVKLCLEQFVINMKMNPFWKFLFETKGEAGSARKDRVKRKMRFFTCLHLYVICNTLRFNQARGHRIVYYVLSYGQFEIILWLRWLQCYLGATELVLNMHKQSVLFPDALDYSP